MTSAGEISVHVTIDEEQMQEVARLAARLLRSEYASAIIAEGPVDVTEEPPVGSQVTDRDGDVFHRFADGWTMWDVDDWGAPGGKWDAVVGCHGPLRLTTDADRERVGLPVDTAPDVDPAKLQAEVTRLTYLLGSHADGHRCTCEMTDPGVYHGDNMHPPEWEQDPWCPTHPDMNVVTAEVKRLAALADRTEKAEAAMRDEVAEHDKTRATVLRLTRERDLHVEIEERLGQPVTAVIKRHGQVVFDGVSREALIRTKESE